MSETRRPPRTGKLLIASALVTAVMTVAVAQQPADDGAQVVIERVALELSPPETYHVAMQLQPVVSVELVARVDGVIASVPVETDQRVAAQESVVQLQSDVRQIELERAQAAFQLARLEHEAAGEGQAGEIAAARLDVATADLQIAQQRLDNLNVRAPFEGTITAVHVIEGQFVRAGDSLATLADLTRLVVDVPVSRNEFAEEDAIEVRVEDTTVRGEVSQILPLPEEFDPLRDLFMAIATARVSLDGAGLSVGQAVSSDMIPRHPVAEIPTAALLNTDDGQRKVQVIREEFVRDVLVQLHGQNGEAHVFVSGRFEPTDELVVESTHELLEGTRIVPAAAAELVQPGPRPRPRGDDDD